MNDSESEMRVEPIAFEQLLPLLNAVPLFSEFGAQQAHCIPQAEMVTLAKGGTLSRSGVDEPFFWIMIEGRIKAYKEKDPGGARPYLIELGPGDTAGEVPLLLGETKSIAYCEAVEDCRVVRLPAAAFWQLLACCPAVREGILKNMAQRYQMYQAITLHQEKLVSLGTLAAGLMHELNNPGAAARRAASQLRENMTRLQSISLRMTRSSLTAEQMECVAELQERVFSTRRAAPLNPLEQSDKEEELSTWLEEIGVESPWRLAPTMVGIGWERGDIECARSSFTPQILSDTLNYLEALISSLQLVGTVEESIARVTDLVTAVKKYAYDDKRGHQQVDVKDSLQSTLVILGHKFRHKQLEVQTSFPAEGLAVLCLGAGLAQVWTNLLDNAIDAAPERSIIEIRLWEEANSICVGILDHGPGIGKEHWEHIYQPFYTTKEVGIGTGLGLDIAHRIVVGNFKGDISFTSEPGRTEFIVRLPKAPVCSVQPA